MNISNTLLILFLLFSGSRLFGLEPYSTTFEENAFPSRYIVLGMTNNYPVSFSQNNFISGGSHPLIGYRYNLEGEWLLGVSTQFKMFKIKETNRALAFFTINHESLYIVRLYHPNYIMIGPKFQYLLPLQAARFPFQKDDKHEYELGAAASLLVGRIFSDHWFVNVRIDRWRGTGSMKFHGVEVALELNYSLSGSHNSKSHSATPDKKSLN